MSALKQELPTITKESYFAFSKHHEDKYEFHDGMLIAMAGGTITHDRIEVALVAEIRARLKGSECEVFSSNRRVSVEASGNYYFPDATVVCGEPQIDDEHGLLNPVLLIEILSRSTALYDRNTKFERYKAIPTLRYYLLISQDVPRLELFSRSDDPADNHWTSVIIEGLEAEWILPFFSKPIRLQELYDNVLFE